MTKIVWIALTAASLLAGGAQAALPEMAARGKYLVTAIGGCNDCHTAMTPTGPDMAHSLQGAPLIFSPTIPIPWAAIAPPIAGGPVGFTEAEFAAFLQTGATPAGVTPPKPPMPAYRMNKDDAEAVAAYIVSLPKKP